MTLIRMAYHFIYIILRKPFNKDLLVEFKHTIFHSIIVLKQWSMCGQNKVIIICIFHTIFISVQVYPDLFGLSAVKTIVSSPSSK